MNKAEYIEIKRSLSFDKPLWVTLLVIIGDAVLVYIAFQLIATGNILAFIASQILLAVFYFHNFALLHECGHGNVHSKRWVNTLIGHYNSIFCYMPYFPWKLMHQEHHVWSGNVDKDPTLENLNKFRAKKDIPWIGRMCWKFWVPMTGLLQHVVFWSYPLTMWKTRKMTRKSFLMSAFSVLWLAIVYFAMFTWLSPWVNLANLWLSWLMYLVMTEMVNMPHHINVPTFHTSKDRQMLHPWEQHISTRSCYYPLYLSELLTLNFNYHTEHHFLPNLPWYRLRQLQRIIRPRLGSEYNKVMGLNWNLQNRSRDVRDVVLPELTHPLLEPPHA